MEIKCKRCDVCLKVLPAAQYGWCVYLRLLTDTTHERLDLCPECAAKVDKVLESSKRCMDSDNTASGKLRWDVS